MLPKVHIFAFQDAWLWVSDHTIVIILVMKICFVQFFWEFLPPFLKYLLLLLGPYLFCPLLCLYICMKYFLGISNFLEEISSLSHSIVFLYFFAFIMKEGFLISLCSSFELCIQMVVSFLSSFAFYFSSFSAICKASSDNHFAFLHFFALRMVLIPVSCTMSQTSVHSSSGTLSIRSNPLNLFVTSTV